MKAPDRIYLRPEIVCPDWETGRHMMAVNDHAVNSTCIAYTRARELTHDEREDLLSMLDRDDVYSIENHNVITQWYKKITGAA